MPPVRVHPLLVVAAIFMGRYVGRQVASTPPPVDTSTPQGLLLFLPPDFPDSRWSCATR
jgi:hypothetical protein